MGDILKEAIADAKAVRETALQNAKMALEEAFTPQLKSMLSAKLREEDDEDEVEEFGHDDEEGEAEEGYHEGEHEEEPAEETYEDEVPGEEVPAEEVPADETYEDEVPGGEGEDELDLESIIRELEAQLGEEEEPSEEEPEVEETIQLNGKTYSLVKEEDDAYDEKVGKTDASHLAEEDDAYTDDVEGKEDPRHVGGTIGEGEDEEEVDIDESLFTEDDDDDDDDKVDEQSDSSTIGAGDNKVDYADSGDEEDPQGGEPVVEPMGESVKLRAQLKEYKEAVSFLKDKLHEVNILNAKLLFTNKLFKQFSLDNNQKLKVVETFDRTQSTREIKLVYSTLAEQFGDNGSIIRKKSINESASSAVSSTKPSKESRKVITEETQVANRFRKLAGLIK